MVVSCGGEQVVEICHDISSCPKDVGIRFGPNMEQPELPKASDCWIFMSFPHLLGGVCEILLQVASPSRSPPRQPSIAGSSTFEAASSRSQWASPDLNRKIECKNLCRIECQNMWQIESQIECKSMLQNKMSEYIPNTMSENMWDRMPEYMSDRMLDYCQRECQSMCRVECQNACQIEC